jgi:hypothetical protein
LNAANYATEIGVPSLHRKHETHSRIFASSFEVDAEARPEMFQMGIMNSQSCEYIKQKFPKAFLLEI